MKALKQNCVPATEAPAPPAATFPASPAPSPSPSPPAGSPVILQTLTINGVAYQVELREPQ